MAWERPDAFRKVVSWIGSFTNIRGGYVYPALIRKTKKEPKPLRVFLQDGSNDLDNLHGNWPLSNQDMAAALKFAGYDYQFEFGDGGHSGKARRQRFSRTRCAGSGATGRAIDTTLSPAPLMNHSPTRRPPRSQSDNIHAVLFVLLVLSALFLALARMR